MDAGAGLTTMYIWIFTIKINNLTEDYNENVKRNLKKLTQEKNLGEYSVKAIYKEINMSQVDKVLDYLNKFGSITTMEAFIDLGITRLAAGISEIENRGITITRRPETVLNRFGQKTHVTRYLKEV